MKALSKASEIALMMKLGSWKKNRQGKRKPEKNLDLIKERLFNIFWDCQNLPLISLAIDCNQYKTRK